MNNATFSTLWTHGSKVPHKILTEFSKKNKTQHIHKTRGHQIEKKKLAGKGKKLLLKLLNYMY